MDLQELVDKFEPMSCVMSVQVFPDGHYGNIRIVCGNKAYVDSIENPANIAFSGMLKNTFVPDSPYEKYIPKDLNFEDACYHCAVHKKPFHTYIHPERYSFWVDMYMMPIAADAGDVYYFVYSMELTPFASESRMSNIDAQVSSSILEISIKLRGAKGFRETMNEVTSDLRQKCDAQNACLVVMDMQRRSFEMLAIATASPDENPFDKRYQEAYKDFFDVIETWDDTIAGSTCLIIQNESDMNVLRERNPKWYKTLEAEGVKSIILYPLKYNDETQGYIWAINYDIEKTAQIRAILETTAYFMAAEIANQKMLDQLKIMGEFDMLTGVLNRNAMNRRVDGMSERGETLPARSAVLFADLNGLKQTNDNAGHASGDILLKKAAEVLKKTFAEGDIYRAGGDEFLIILNDVSEQMLDEKMKQLEKYRFDTEKVSFAVGCCYSDSTMDIRQAMSIADKRMYEDKQLYYQRFPKE